MKNWLLSILLILITSTTNAQYVNIPDTAFAALLRKSYPSAMSGSMMDTNNFLIINTTELNYDLKMISNLYGIQFFDNLQKLICTRNVLTSIPALPPRLRILDCSQNFLTSLPSLPDTLRYLNCGYNKLSALPFLPDSLTSLDCFDNLLSSLPSLPDSLTFLECLNNKLTTIPFLPQRLKYLSVVANNLSTLPALPDSLKTLYCQSNKLKSLPSFPAHIEQVNCSYNELTSLPDIPLSLFFLDARSNPSLNCLPSFRQDTFVAIMVRANTGVVCLPKKIAVSSHSDDGSHFLPVCPPAAGCPIAYNIGGNIHKDTSVSCLLDSLFPGGYLNAIKVQKFNNGVLDQQQYTSYSGYYGFSAKIGDTVELMIDTAGLPFIVSCPAIFKRQAIVTTTDSVFYNQDFGIECAGADLGVQSIYGTFRSNASRPVYIQAGDLSQYFGMGCGSGISGTVTTTLSGMCTYVAPLSGALSPSSVSDSTLTYNIMDFGTIDMNQAFGIEVKTDSLAMMGSYVCIKTTVNTTVTDRNLSNNTLDYCGIVVNSFDPNEKIAYPSELINADEWITYTINFQNTGTDTAYHIIVRDTLDSDLNLSTFTFLASSHKAQVSLDKNAVMFNFPHINLIDSLHDEPNSHGWLQFKIKTLPSFSNVSVVHNKASIYFDDNDPIVTNTTSNANPKLSLPNFSKATALRLYPNPTSETLNIDVAEPGKIVIFNLLGSSVYTSKIEAGHHTLSISELSSGIYLYRFVTESGEGLSQGRLHIK